MEFELTWPPKELWPNRSSGKHWTHRATAAKNYKVYCGWNLLSIKKWEEPGNIQLNIVFHPPDKRRRDLDGCHSALKHGLDTLAERMGVDDVRFRPITLDMGEVVKGGKVVIRIC